MMLLRGPQSLTRHPSLGEPATELSLRVVAAAGGRASQAIAEYQRLGRDEFLDAWGSAGQPDTCCVSGAGSSIRKQFGSWGSDTSGGEIGMDAR
jgi:hypothetical protein